MKSEIKNGVLVISLDGAVVGAHVNGPVLDLVKSSLEAGNKKFIFNMLESKFVDSTGLGTMLSAASKIRSAGGELVLCSLPEQVKKLLKMTKLDAMFNQQADEEAALNILTK